MIADLIAQQAAEERDRDARLDLRSRLHDGRPLGVVEVEAGRRVLHLKDPKGGDPAEWPDDLRVRQWPRTED